jgi:hypothetical protein
MKASVAVDDAVGAGRRNRGDDPNRPRSPLAQGHVPLWQVPVAHTVPQAPQFVLLVWVSTQAPLQSV